MPADGDGGPELLNGTSVGTKSGPNLSADLVGGWREEVIFLCGNNLRMYTTTTRRIYTLMYDPRYRMNVSSENSTYNQPPHPSLAIGAGMAAPPWPNITVE